MSSKKTMRKVGQGPCMGLGVSWLGLWGRWFLILCVGRVRGNRLWDCAFVKDLSSVAMWEEGGHTSFWDIQRIGGVQR